MIRRQFTFMLAAAVLALSSCARDAPDQPQPFDVPAAAAATTRPALTPAEVELYGPQVELPGGLLQKKVGKVAQFGGPDDEDNSTWGIRVVVDSIAVDAKCDPYMPKPERGHRLLITMRVETSPLYNEARDGYGPSFYEWSTVGPDGVSEAPMTSGSPCRAATELPPQLRPSAKYRATVGVDTANPSGLLVWNNFAAWKYPA